MFEEFVAFARDHGFSIDNPQLDGRIHRFRRDSQRRDQSAYYIGFVNYTTQTGERYVVVIFGDWRTGERFQYETQGTKLSREDRAAIKKRIEEASKKQEEEKLKRNEEAAAEAEFLWGQGKDVRKSPYFERKKIDQLYGAKTLLEDAGRAILVPMRDIAGKLWGVQRIYGNGMKRFQSGQRISGCYHMIGEMTHVIYLCEGYSTGVAIHQATGMAVVCAFNAGNLLPVAQEIRRAFPSSQVIVAGDDDRHVKKPDGTPWNPGREKAEKAAAALGTKAIFPSFNDPSSELSDFNDMLIEQGLDAVRGLLEQESSDIEPTSFVPLGFEESTHFFYATRQRSIVKCSSFGSSELLNLQPLEVWQTLYPGKGDGGVSWTQAKNTLIQASVAKGPFDSFRIRGTGAWYDRGRVVINTGRELLANGRKTSLAGFDSRFVYIETKNKMPPIHPNALTAHDAGMLDRICQALSWRRGYQDGIFLAGWIALARVAGALPVRPHLWLTGSSGSGKSTVMDMIIRPSLGSSAGKIYLQGGSTEAGIRQSIKADSIPIIFDEFETNGPGSADRVLNLVELLRQSWSHTQGTVVKGSASGVACQYALSFAALVSSIRVNLDNDADRSRFTVIELGAPLARDKWDQLVSDIQEYLTEEFGERLFARMSSRIPMILNAYKTFSKVVSRKINARYGQQYGMLLAGWWCLNYDELPSQAQVDSIAQDLDLNEQRETAELTDEIECANMILTTKVSVDHPDKGTKQLTIGELIGLFGFHDQLQKYGIAVRNDCLVVANSHESLRRSVFKETRWANCWSRVLSRIPGAERKQAKIGGQNMRCTIIPLHAIGAESPVKSSR